ncbi:MAG TPA: START domain-containing protein [Chitinophagaceae bacterium]|nr:START domain-containing protein [Chitinophagaceae bacterium]
MVWKRILLAGIVVLFFTNFLQAQNNWELKVDRDGIKVYTKKLDSSPLKAVKTVCTINTSLSVLTAVLLDVNGSLDWVYSTKSITLLKQVSPSELIYYSEIDVPWPASNRDFIVGIVVTQDERTKAVTVLGINKPNYLPEKKDIVRIQQSYSKWLITPIPQGGVKIEYELQVDPGGKVPAWLVNMFATKGPFETFKKLQQQVKKPVYSRRSFAFVKE